MPIMNLTSQCIEVMMLIIILKVTESLGNYLETEEGEKSRDGD